MVKEQNSQSVEEIKDNSENLEKKDKKKEDKKENLPKTMKIVIERDIAMDFATKVYQKFDKLIKSVIYFGSSAKKVSTSDSDIDLIILTDDVSVKWDSELIAWYREELGKIVQLNPYRKSLHINTVKLSTWWEDMLRGDPIIINVIRFGESLIDYGAFFEPLKVLLQEGKIKPTPESIFTLLQRTPEHMARTRMSMLGALDGLYWAMVDSSHAALIAAKVMPPSPEHIPSILQEQFVDNKMLKSRYVDDFKQVYSIAKEVVHGKRTSITGKEIDELTEKTNNFVEVMAKLVDDLISVKN